MRWLTRGGLGLAILAALALGRVITDRWSDAGMDERAFVRTGDVGQTVRMTWADVRVTRVAATDRLATANGAITTSGTFLVLDMTITPHGHPLSSPSITVTDARGRTFVPDGGGDRAVWVIVDAQTGVPCYARVPVEMPRGDLAGAVLHLSTNSTDTSTEDVARVDLGISRSKAATLASSTAIPVTSCSAKRQPEQAS